MLFLVKSPTVVVQLQALQHPCTGHMCVHDRTPRLVYRWFIVGCRGKMHLGKTLHQDTSLTWNVKND